MPTRHARRLPAALLALAVALTACGGDPEPEATPRDLSTIGLPAPTEDPSPEATATATATADVGDTSQVDLTVIPDGIDDTYVAALARETVGWMTDAALTVEDGNPTEDTEILVSSNTAAAAADRVRSIVIELAEAVEDPAGEASVDLVEIGTTGSACTSALVAIRWAPLAPGFAGGTDWEYWMAWVEAPGDSPGVTAWDFLGVGIRAGGGQEVDPCTE
ncbi:MAG: hypothetical protein ACLGIR_00855 [Actinomycetes bacterium]